MRFLYCNLRYFHHFPLEWLESPRRFIRPDRCFFVCLFVCLFVCFFVALFCLFLCFFLFVCLFVCLFSCCLLCGVCCLCLVSVVCWLVCWLVVYRINRPILHQHVTTVWLNVGAREWIQQVTYKMRASQQLVQHGFYMVAEHWATGTTRITYITTVRTETWTWTHQKLQQQQQQREVSKARSYRPIGTCLFRFICNWLFETPGTASLISSVVFAPAFSICAYLQSQKMTIQ